MEDRTQDLSQSSEAIFRGAQIHQGPLAPLGWLAHGRSFTWAYNMHCNLLNLLRPHLSTKIPVFRWFNIDMVKAKVYINVSTPGNPECLKHCSGQANKKCGHQHYLVHTYIYIHIYIYASETNSFQLTSGEPPVCILCIYIYVHLCVCTSIC